VYNGRESITVSASNVVVEVKKKCGRKGETPGGRFIQKLGSEAPNDARLFGDCFLFQQMPATASSRPSLPFEAIALARNYEKHHTYLLLLHDRPICGKTTRITIPMAPSAPKTQRIRL
jgi:hypothetical protein